MDPLHKEAVYRLTAVAADELHGAVDFRSWLHSALVPEARSGAGVARGPDPVRRQALLLPSYWLGVLRPEDRPPLYEATLRALGRDSDLAIRLAGLVTLTALVEDWCAAAGRGCRGGARGACCLGHATEDGGWGMGGGGRIAATAEHRAHNRALPPGPRGPGSCVQPTPAPKLGLGTRHRPVPCTTETAVVQGL